MISLLAFISNWLGERLRYLLMWPINLVRDFPFRVYRLFQTTRILILGLLFLLPEFIDAVRYRELLRWVRYKIGRIISGLHQVVAQLFDLFGGPELSQFLIHFFTATSPLTGEEITMMAAIAGPDAMRYGDVRVAQGGVLDVIFRLNGYLAFATWHTINLPRKGLHTRANHSLLAHELTHVYQYERVGSRYLGEAIYILAKTRRDCYDYGGREGLVQACSTGIRYGDYNREQQAKIVQDYFFLQQIGGDVSAYDPFIADLQAGLL